MCVNPVILAFFPFFGKGDAVRSDVLQEPNSRIILYSVKIAVPLPNSIERFRCCQNNKIISLSLKQCPAMPLPALSPASVRSRKGRRVGMGALSPRLLRVLLVQRFINGRPCCEEFGNDIGWQVPLAHAFRIVVCDVHDAAALRFCEGNVWFP